MHEFQAPVWSGSTLMRHRVWGMTARILVDAARIAYARDPEFSFMDLAGDEALIKLLLERGELGKEKVGVEKSLVYSMPQKEGKGNL